MVKPRLLPSRPKLKLKQAQPSSSSVGAPRVGTRALTRTTASFGANLLSSLRRSLLRGRNPAVPVATSPPAAVSYASVSTPVVKPSSPAILQPKAPKPPPGADGEDSDDSEDDEEDGEEEGRPGEISGKKPRKKAKRTSHGLKRWVPKLLNPVEKHRDRVHRKKKHAVSSYTGPPALFTESRTLHTVLLARIFAFLDPVEPAKTTAYVNQTTAAAVRAYYDLYCPPPRPRRYLVHRILEDPRSVFPAKLMALLPVNDRVRASASCRSFYAASNTLPLEFHGSKAAQQFLKYSGFPRTRYIQKRYAKTPALAFSDMKAEAAVGIIQLLEGAGDDDEEEENEDDSDCFAAVREISLTRVSGFAAAKGKYFERMLQAFFMGHVSSRLHTLELTDLKLTDLQFKHFARLLRDARFPALRSLNLSHNAFSSRFVRDWSWSFVNERFMMLQALDVSDTGMSNEDLQRFVACLSKTPALQRLVISHNLCSFATFHKLREQIEAGTLNALVEFECVAITADAVAMGHLLEVFQMVPPRCPHLQLIDLSGNPLNNAKSVTQLARIFASSPQSSSGWRELTTLNLSGMQLGDDGFRAIATAISQGQATHIQHLDLSDNGIGSAMEIFVHALAGGKLAFLRSLAIADNELGALEFEALGSTLATNCCPRLQTLDLSANFARGEGTSRFCPFLLSPPAQRLWALDLSQNEIPHRGLIDISETLARGNCSQLHELNLSRNAELRGIVKFLDLIRGGKCPSLTILQVGYAQSAAEGYALVKDTLKRMSVEELRRLKQQRFEQRLAAVQLQNDAKAARNQKRCIRQCQHLRELYDHLENEADRALRRRKLIRKSKHLLIHQEITRLKQERQHRLLCRELDRDV